VTVSARRWQVGALGIPALLCAGWTVFAGKDLNWDLLHYHYYIAAAFAEGRLGQDYFAASAQSYLHPLGYVPFYLMVQAGWHAVLVSVVLAAAHAANITLLFIIARSLLAHRESPGREILSALGAALGAASAVYWTMVGTSFADILLSVPMLGGVALLLGARPGNAAWRAAWAGILFGIAASLKYSNAFFALAAIVLAAAPPSATPRERFRSLAAYGAGGLAAVALFAGPWLMRMYREFGNPFLPHLNAWFRSPDFLPINLSAGRYAPADGWEFLAFPFRLMSPQTLTYVEISAPDLRFAALAVLAAAAALSAATARFAPRLRPRGAAPLGAQDTRMFAFFVAALVLWMETSANGRYGLVVLLLAGPCIARLTDRVLPPRAAPMALLVLLAMQIAVCAMNSPARWFIAERWSRDWFPYAVPGPALEQPALYLTVETQAMAVIAPFVHPGSSFVNLRGQKGATPGWQRIVAPRLSGDGGAVRTIGRGLRLGADGKPRPEVVQGYASTLARFGWRVDPTACFAIDWRTNDDDALSRWANALAGELPSRANLFSLASCALVPAEPDPRETAQEQRVSRIFDRMERECAHLFRGETAVTDRYGAEWSRTYTGLDARLETQAGRAVLAPFFRLLYYDLGNLADWEKESAPRPLSCSK
jgi:hypothetical protein